MNKPAEGRLGRTEQERQTGIAVSDATVTYRNGLTALNDATFTIPTGSIAALVGVNGAGKSTLFKAIMGFVRLAKARFRFSACRCHRR
nr:ATP-binding cassette domain-containing protein [Marinicella sp. W31]MDC2879612.1 ATP-binding cassette domain-containing protein [Marinicella sp. W31]